MMPCVGNGNLNKKNKDMRMRSVPENDVWESREMIIWIVWGTLKGLGGGLCVVVEEVSSH